MLFSPPNSVNFSNPECALINYINLCQLNHTRFLFIKILFRSMQHVGRGSLHRGHNVTFKIEEMAMKLMDGPSVKEMDRQTETERQRLRKYQKWKCHLNRSNLITQFNTCPTHLKFFFFHFSGISTFWQFVRLTISQTPPLSISVTLGMSIHCIDTSSMRLNTYFLEEILSLKSPKSDRRKTWTDPYF